MATGKQRDARAARERARLYQARQQFHDGRAKRRTRDNLIAAIGGGALILAVVGGQVAYFTLGPGAPEPAPSATPTPTPTSTMDAPATPTPDDSVEPAPETTPTP
ncbi:dioxygenase [Microbacterium sp. BWT-B31]|uniref:dioxygenase n=1 Tax=Microbacterium sp. BWT-B31 TaxID=3232072 RepID=UPI0035280CC7